MSTNRWRPDLGLGLFLGVALLTVACGKPQPGPGPGRQGGAEGAPVAAASPSEVAPRELRIVYHPPKTLDWTAGADVEATALARNLYEGLRVLAPDARTTEPGAAVEPEGSADGRSFVFRLRDDARWSDGTPVTAFDFVEAWAHCWSPGVQCGLVEPFDRLLAPPEGGFEAVDARTVRVWLAHPHPLLPFALATTAFLPVPRGVRAARPSDWMLPPHALSNGPWRLAEYRPGVEAVLVPNPHHRAAASLALDRVRVTFVQTQENGDALFRAGRADLVFGMIPIERIRELRAKGDPSLVLWPAACTFLLGLNTQAGPTADPAFRRALAAAVDREKLALQVLGMGQAPALSLAPPSLWSTAAPALPAEPFSPARAREAYRASTHAATPEVPVPFLLNESAGNRLIAEAVQRDVQEALGVKLELQVVEWGALVERLAKGDFSVVRYSMCAALPDPAAFAGIFRSASEDNPSRYHDANVDAALDRLVAAPTPAARERLLAEVEARLAADAAAIPLYHYARAWLVRPCVRGLVPNAFDVQRFERIDLAACASAEE